MKAFKKFFERIVWQCVTADLIDGRKVFVDASLIDADASNNSVVDTHKLEKYLNKSHQRLENRLDEIKASKKTPADSRHILPPIPMPRLGILRYFGVRFGTEAKFRLPPLSRHFSVRRFFKNYADSGSSTRSLSLTLNVEP